jgi:hypothetical protein
MMLMNPLADSSMNVPSEVRRQVEAYCQLLVDAGLARWRASEVGDIELHMDTGETYRLGDLGVTRLR